MCGWEVNRYGSGLFSVAVFGIRGVECFGSAAKRFINQQDASEGHRL